MLSAVDAQASAYAAALSRVIDPILKQVLRHALPLASPTINRQDAADFRTITQVFGQLRVGVMSALATSVDMDAQRTATAVGQRNKTGTERLMGVDLLSSEPYLAPLLDDWVTQNVSLVRSVAEGTLSDLEATILRMARGDASIKDIRKELVDVFNVGKQRARMLARDQVSKLNGQLTEERQTRLGVDEYIWHTVEDQRVRPDHARLDGETFKWSDPPVTVKTGKRAGERNHPGGDIQCRCWAEPVLDDLLNT